MNKKKLIALVTCLLLIVAIAVGGTLAYFNDTDTATNVFTIGNVDIALEEYFPEDELMPGENNALDKVVTVKNIGPNPAYMWVELWIPSILDDVNDASKNDLHMNCFDTYLNENGEEVLVRGSVAAANGYGDPVYVTVIESLGDKEYNDISYNGYRVYIENDTPKTTGQSTAALLARVFMDKDVKLCTDKMHAENCLVLKDGTHYTGTWEIIVNAYGMQSQGFATIEDAIASYDGEDAYQFVLDAAAEK